MQIIAKKFLKMIRVLYFTLRKGISKTKLLADLDMMMKRGKIAGKSAMDSLVLHHHAAAAAVSPDRQFAFPVPLNEYEFSCSSRRYRFPFHLNKRKHSEESVEMEETESATESPALPGLGRSPVRQLRITNSPFPLTEIVEEDNGHVDQAAEMFIARFYTELKRENSVACLDYSY